MAKIKHLGLLTLVLPFNIIAATVYEDDKHKLDVKGRVVGMYIDNDDKGDDESYLRLGLKGKSHINDSLYAVGRFEVQWSVKDEETDTRLAYAGLGGNWGEITYGRQYGAYSLVTDFTDILFEFGGDASGAGTDRFGTGKADSLIKYEGVFKNLSVHANYQLDNEKVKSADNKNATSVGVALQYELPIGLSIGAGYNAGKGTTKENDSDVMALALAYSQDQIFASALYSKGKNWKDKIGTESNNDYIGYEAVIGFKPTKELTVQAGYNKLILKGKNSTNDVDKKDYFTVGAQYKFNKQFRVFTEYKFDQLDNQSDELALALRYDF
jgi:outer membrane porin protein LC